MLCSIHKGKCLMQKSLKKKFQKYMTFFSYNERDWSMKRKKKILGERKKMGRISDRVEFSTYHFFFTFRSVVCA